MCRRALKVGRGQIVPLGFMFGTSYSKTSSLAPVCVDFSERWFFCGVFTLFNSTIGLSISGVRLVHLPTREPHAFLRVSTQRNTSAPRKPKDVSFFVNRFPPR